MPVGEGSHCIQGAAANAEGVGLFNLQSKFGGAPCAALRLAGPFGFAQGTLPRRPSPHNLVIGLPFAGSLCCAIDSQDLYEFRYLA
jgi:hypothetical protein